MEDNRKTDTVKTVCKFIYDNFPRARDQSLTACDSLIESGVVDSLGLLTVIDFIESTFKITVSDTDVNVKNFDTVESIAEYIESALS